ncbi:MAG: glucosaminidase domain-containing protein [Bacteroidota bacterium]
MKFSRFFILIVILVFAASCGSKKKAVAGKTEGKQTASEVSVAEQKELPQKRYADVVEEYISEFSVIAQEEMRLYKIPASITLAQGILESGAGKGDLTRRANNHFGIKCHNWEGDKVYHDDDLSQECFRKYNDPKFSYRDHSLFLSERLRYAKLFELEEDDYEGWAKGLRAAGYATDRLYPTKLISLIERYELYNYDAEVLGKITRKSSIVQKGGSTHYVRKGDTLYSIAKRYNTTVEMLQRNNNLRGTEISIGQELTVESN